MPIHRTSVESAVPTTTTNELLNGNVKKTMFAICITYHSFSFFILENTNIRYEFIYGI